MDEVVESSELAEAIERSLDRLQSPAVAANHRLLYSEDVIGKVGRFTASGGK